MLSTPTPDKQHNIADHFKGIRENAIQQKDEIKELLKNTVEEMERIFLNQSTRCRRKRNVKWIDKIATKRKQRV